MGFPIAISAKSSSSRPIALSSPVEEYADDGSPLEPIVLKGGPRVTMAVNNEATLSATLSLSYYDMMRPDGVREMTVIDLRVQISPLACPYSSSYRDSLHRIPIPDFDGNPQVEASPQLLSTKEVRPSAVFSADGRSLNCLVPCPRLGRSVLVALQLRKRIESNRPLPPPLPSYANGKSTKPSFVVPVATNPRIVVDSNGSCVKNATAICEASTVKIGQKGLSVLLVGCRNGSILAISHNHRRAPVAATVVLAPFGGDTIVCMQHVTESIGNLDRTSWGKLLAIRRNGSATVFSSHLVWASNSTAVDTPVMNGVGCHLTNHNEEELGIEASPLTEKSSNVTRREVSVVIEESSTSTNDIMTMKMRPLTILEAPDGESTSFCCARWISSNLLAFIESPRLEQRAAAQVWAVYEDRPAQLISSLIITAERLEEDSHGTFFLGEEKEEEEANMNQCENNTHRKICRDGPTALDYDQHTGCLAVSSVLVSRDGSSRNDKNPLGLIAQPYVCIWHWLTDVVGMTLVARNTVQWGLRNQTLISRPYFSYDEQQGRYLVHIIARYQHNWNNHHRVRKEVHKLATLSPPDSRYNIGYSIQEASSVMLSSNSVTYPLVTHPSSNKDHEIEWVESCVPASYISKFGLLKVAAVGKRKGNSIAVASSRGVCILRTNQESQSMQISSETLAHSQAARQKLNSLATTPKWRLFGSPTEERGFKILAMTWWELNHDDLLVTVIQMESGSQYLSCWSRRRLDFGGQLIIPSEQHDTKRINRKGVQLPAGFQPAKISLLAEPASDIASEMGTHGNTIASRAIVLLSSSNGQKGVSYLAYQLQLLPTERYSKNNFENSRVVCKLGSSGIINLDHWLNEGTATTLFLAGATFDFKLCEGIPAKVELANDFIATIGIIRTPGLGLDAVVISSDGPAACSRIIAGIGANKIATSSQIAKYWLSDIMRGNRCKNEGKLSPINAGSFFVWVFELFDGNLLCWAAPYFDDRYEKSSFGSYMTASDPLVAAKCFVDMTGGNLPPARVSESETFGCFIGLACSIGDSSTWMSDSPAAQRSEFTLSSIPNRPFGCILCAGQTVKKLHRVVPDDFDSSSSSSLLTKFLDHEVFGIGDCILMPPAFVASLFTCFLGLAGSHITDLVQKKNIPMELIDDDCGLSVPKQMLYSHVFARLRDESNKDGIMMALRLLILRSLESLSAQGGKKVTSALTKQSVFLSSSLFSEVVDAARFAVSPLQFTSLFLGIGRQIEPHYFRHLFPLPLAVQTYTNSSKKWAHYEWRTVEELYRGSVRNGSLSISSSALPLCLAKTLSQRKCAELLRHCLRSLSENTASDISIIFDASREERECTGDLFRYGMKIEDAEIVNGVDDNFAGDDKLASGIIQYLDESNEENKNHQPQEGSPRPLHKEPGSLFKLFLPFLCRGYNRNRLEEDAIYEAASSFILSGFEEYEIGNYLGTTPGSNTSSNPSNLSDSLLPETGDTGTVAGVVGQCIVSIAFGRGESEGDARWERVYAVACLILGDKHVPFEASSQEVETFKSVSTDIAMGDLSAAILCYIDRNSQTSTSRSSNKTSEEKQLVVNFLVCQILECEYELTKGEASKLVDLMLVLVSRQATSHDVQGLLPELITLTVLFAHIADRIDGVLGLSYDPKIPVWTCYAMASDELTDSV